MTTFQGPRKRLPENPSEENLRKQAKRLASQEDLQLAVAQRRLAGEYGYKNWAELMRAVASRFVPLVPLRGLVAFPHEVYPIYIGRRKSIRAIDAAGIPETPISLTAKTPILLVAQRDETIAEPSAADMYEVGTLGVIVEHQRLPDGSVKIMVEGKKRAKVSRFVFDQKFFKAEVEEVADTERLNPLDIGLSRLGLPQPLSNDHARALWRSVLSALNNYTRVKRKTVLVRELEDPGILPYMVARHLNIELAEQQALLETVNPVERLERILGHLETAN